MVSRSLAPCAVLNDPRQRKSASSSSAAWQMCSAAVPAPIFSSRQKTLVLALLWVCALIISLAWSITATSFGPWCRLTVSPRISSPDLASMHTCARAFMEAGESSSATTNVTGSPSLGNRRQCFRINTVALHSRMRYSDTVPIAPTFSPPEPCDPTNKKSGCSSWCNALRRQATIGGADSVLCPLSKYSNLATWTGSSVLLKVLCRHVTLSFCGPAPSYCRLARMLDVLYAFRIRCPWR
mmetsp:Transcript_62503/g.147394  ORF Transcript_62503/g.147394 Transcript_62503/m.147394 type:complete len:239 (+) Transcript_62503:373-1089(+)